MRISKLLTVLLFAASAHAEEPRICGMSYGLIHPNCSVFIGDADYMRTLDCATSDYARLILSCYEEFTPEARVESPYELEHLLPFARYFRGFGAVITVYDVEGPQGAFEHYKHCRRHVGELVGRNWEQELEQCDLRTENVD